MTDVWFCPNCHSVNRQRDSRCYRCHTPQTAAAGTDPEVRINAAIANRAVTKYRSTRLLAIVTIGVILVVATLGIAITIAGLADVAWMRDQVRSIVNGGSIDEGELLRRTERLAGVLLLRLGLAIVALILFAGWLARVIGNIPALGGGIPSRTPARAFIYTLIPVWNLFKVPGMIQDALYRVEPKAGGFFMVAIAWIGLVGSWFVDQIGTRVIAARFTADVLSAGTNADAISAGDRFVDQLVGLDVVTSAMVAAGAVVLVLIMIRIQRRMVARDREIRTAFAARMADVPEPDSAI